MERNLDFVQGLGCCVMFPYESPHDCSFCIDGSAGGLALWQKQSTVCTQSSVSEVWVCLGRIHSSFFSALTLCA